VENNPALPFNVTGTTDVLVVEREAVTMRFPTRGIRMALEIKKAVAQSHAKQAVVEEVLSDIHSIFPVITALTDLGNDWQFFLV